VLIVEDDPDALDTLHAWTEQLGCEVRTVRSGTQALEVSSGFKPHVLITDYLLEDDVTGVDVIVGTKKQHLDVTCVLITAVLHEALRESLHRIHGVIILAKPVNLERLRPIISHA
jgi:DNA-binding NtrC family response regulator